MTKSARAAELLMAACLAACSLGGCVGTTEFPPRLEVDTSPPADTKPRRPPLVSNVPIEEARVSHEGAFVVPGAENLRVRSPLPVSQGATQQSGGYVLNFDNTDIHDVLKAVLGEMLQLAYSVDPSVQGNISLHTSKALPADAVLPTFEDALKMAGVALVRQGAGFSAVPLQVAAKRGTLALRGEAGRRAGYSVEIIPLRFAAAAEIQRVLEPLVDTGTMVQVDSAHNMIVVAGTDSELARVDQTVGMFDVDWLKSQSFGLFPLKYSSAKSVVTDLESVLGPQSPLSSLVRVIPIDHLNAILVVSSRLAYVEEMHEWISRFDRGHPSSQPRLFVYRVQNGRAADLAGVLSRALNLRTGNSAESSSGGAAANGAAPEPLSGQQAGLAVASPQSAPTGPNPLLGGLEQGETQRQPDEDVKITADEANNALWILATPEKFVSIEAALQQADTVPLQVLLESCVAEVTLTNSLEYGLQYAFQTGHLSGLAANAAAGSLVPATGGLSIAYVAGNSIQAVLDLLSSVSKVKVVSAPKLLVLNNHTASIDVGDQVPVATSTAVGVVTANAPVVNTIQMVDTGIILHVTPRANGNGLVLMDVNQEVSSSVPTTSSSINSPTIQQRKVSSTIAVQDGQTIAIGGLISDTRTRSKSGIPLLMNVPYVGSLFSLTNDSVNRTELIVLITPHVIRDQWNAQAITDEMQQKLPMIRGLLRDRSR